MRERWRVFAVRGYISLIAGIVFFIRPQMSIQGMLQVFSVLLLLSGTSLLILALMVDSENRILRAAESLLFFIAAVLIYFNISILNPDIFVTIAVWAAFTGLVEIIFSYMRRKSQSDEWIIIINSLLALVFALINAYGVFHGTSLVIIVFGTFSVLNGLMILFFAYRIKYIRIWKL